MCPSSPPYIYTHIYEYEHLQLVYLRPAVALILGFVGVKMVAEYFHVHVPTPASLAVVVGLLAGGIGLSLLDKRKRPQPPQR